MKNLGHVLQIAGIIIAPLGLVHSCTTGDYMSEGALMTWELGCLFVGAALLLLGRRLAGEQT